MNQPVHQSLRHRGPAAPTPAVVGMTSIEEETVNVRLFLEHVGEMFGHDLEPWAYDQHGVVRSSCRRCGREARISYRANGEPRHTYQLAAPCSAQRIAQAG